MSASHNARWIERGKSLRIRAANLRVHGQVADAEKVEIEASRAEWQSRRVEPPDFPMVEKTPIHKHHHNCQCHAATYDTQGSVSGRQCTRLGQYDGLCYQHYQMIVEGKKSKTGHRPRRTMKEIGEGAPMKSMT